MAVQDASAADLSCTRYDVGRVTVVRAVGEIDLDSAPGFRDALFAAAVRGGQRVVVDLSGVGFMDCVALSVLVAAHNRVRQPGGDVCLVISVDVDYGAEATADHPPDGVFPIYRSVDEALGPSVTRGRGRGGRTAHRQAVAR